jgi:hypothetical protein
MCMDNECGHAPILRDRMSITVPGRVAGRQGFVGPTIRRLADLSPRTLGRVQGRPFAVDGVLRSRALADDCRVRAAARLMGDAFCSCKIASTANKAKRETLNSVVYHWTYRNIRRQTSRQLVFAALGKSDGSIAAISGRAT